MSLYEKIINREEQISVIGLGYVGMPIAVAFAEKANVIGFDLNENKILQYKEGFDLTNEVGNEVIKHTTVNFTTDETLLKTAKFHIIAVPTPVNQDKTPDLSPVEAATKLLGRNLNKGSIIVYESTVYPGVTEEVCIPILEYESGLHCGVDFKIGYSPERINPGDKLHRLENIKKIVSGMDEESLNEIADVYSLVIKAGVHKAPCIKVAEAAKVVENSQRDINIAFMNELAMVFDKMEIDTNDVIEAMNTKWNALGFKPGLVGGHCIGVDPYYFVYKAENLGYHSQIIASGRKVNDGMGKFVADAVIKELILSDKRVSQSKILVMGMTFKENCPDIRNSKVNDILERLSEYHITPLVSDPLADKDEVYKEYGIALVEIQDIKDLDCVILAVSHDDYKAMSVEDFDALYQKDAGNGKVLIDIKGMLERERFQARGYKIWRL